MKKEGISIIIPTYGDSKYLNQVLNSILMQKVNGFNVEVLIVAQLKSDIFRVLRDFPKTNIKLRIYNLSTKGVCRARNFGTIKSRNNLLIYIDDDILPVDSGWLDRIWKLYIKNNFSVACGKIELVSRLPHRINRYKALYAYFNFGPVAKHLPLGSFFPSAQFIIERKLMIKTGGFRKDLDRVGKALLSGGDDELCVYFGILKQQVYYNPLFKVTHLISKERLGINYLHKRLFWQGVTDIIVLKYLNKLSLKDYFFISERWLHSFIRITKGVIKRNKNSHLYWDVLYYDTGKVFGLIKYMFFRDIYTRPFKIESQL